MTKSDKIRALRASGASTADIARQLGIRYQHAYNVLVGTSKKGAKFQSDTVPEVKKTVVKKGFLTVQTLADSGFYLAGHWALSEDKLIIEHKIPRESGVYVFVKEGVAQYVGVATVNLLQRLKFYISPGVSQRTNLRLNEIIRTEIYKKSNIEIYVACPPEQTWNGLPVHVCAGLELGLIKKYHLPWNIRSV